MPNMMKVVLNLDEWYDIEDALKLAEISQLSFVERAFSFLESSNHCEINRIVEIHKDKAENFNYLFRKISSQLCNSNFWEGYYCRKEEEKDKSGE